MAYLIKQKNSDHVIASDSDVVLLEGNWYFSPEAVDMTYLKLTNRTYTCPYKGVCFWLDLQAPGTEAKNVAWVYQHPKPGYERIQNKIGFYARDTAGTVAVEGI